MGKNPAFQFYAGDWKKDPQVSLCKPATRGIWMDALCAMHEMDHRGQLSGTLDSLARVCRCRADEMRAAIDDLQSTGAADVTERNGIVTLKNRRMTREATTRENNALRQERYRHNAKVTPPSSSSKDTKHTTPEKKHPPPLKGFEEFWQAYPRKVGRGAAEKAWQRMKPALDAALKAVAMQAQSEQWNRDGGQFIPYPATWLNQKRWQDEVQNGSPQGNSGSQRKAAEGTRRIGHSAADFAADIERAKSSGGVVSTDD